MDFSARSLARGMTSIVIAGCVMAVFAGSAAAVSPSFDPPTGLDLAGNASSVAVGDFDGDSRKDLAAAYGQAAGAVSVWLGTGNPAAAFAHQSPDVAAGVQPGATVVRDFNGDGRDDLAVANTGTPGDGGDDDVTILLGSPSGLVRGETLTVRDTPLGLDAGDLDGDGHLDLVVANSGAGTPAAPSVHVSLLSGDGKGHFDAANIAVGCQPAGVAIADLTDAPGHELGVACLAPAAVRVFAFVGGRLYQLGSDQSACGDSPVGIAAGNFDGLGTADLAVTCLQPWFAVLGSDSGFAPLPGPNHTAAQPEPRFPLAPSPQGQRSLLSVEVADVNSDGFDDVLATDIQRGDAVIADGRANARFMPETVVQGTRRVGNTFPIGLALTGVTAADVNEDGRSDLVASAGNRILIRYATTPVPGVRTGSASSVGHNTATAGAVVNPSGTQTANDTTYRFEYGTTAAYGQTTAALPEGRSLAGDSYVPVSGVLGGLAPETEYHYRVVASNGHGTTYGRDRTFRTGATPPPPAAASADSTPPRLTLTTPRRIGRAKLLKNGVRVTVGPDEPSTLAFELVGSTRKVRLARVGDVVLAARTLPLAAGRRSVTLKLPRAVRRGLSRRFTLTIRVTATDSGGNRTVSTRRLTVR
jgi:VCBS repeat protein/FG-GAP repeat protein